MNKITSNNKEEVAAKGNWLQRRFLPILTLAIILTIVIGIFYVFKKDPGKIYQLKDYGYLGVFLSSLLFNATLILPVGNILVITTLGAALPSPLLVGLVGGIGAAIGEMTGYMAGYSGSAIIRKGKRYARLEQWVKKWGVLAVFLLSLLPLFFDLAGMAAGALRMPVWKFLLACWLGRTTLYIVAALAGAWGWETILSYFNLESC